MLETIMQLYVMSMTGKVHSPTPHLFGPPGCGKSTVCQQLANMVDKTLHTINVSRLSPLEIEGLQMPVDQNTRLHMLTATFWTRLKDGDIVLFDEFLRGFPEVYNGLLDIMTSRQVGDYKLPNVFFIAASNSTVAYDKALEDRLLHIPVTDPRTDAKERKRLAKMIVDKLGLMPDVALSIEMDQLFTYEILPMFAVLDQLQHKAASGAAPAATGQSIRRLIGQAQLRYFDSSYLIELIQTSNTMAKNANKFQYVVLLNGKNPDPRYVKAAKSLVGNERLTEVQAINLNLNLQLISMENARKEIEEADDDDVID